MVARSSRGFRYLLAVPGLIALCLLALYLAGVSAGQPVIRQGSEVRLVAHSHGHSCKYSLVLVSERPTALARQVSQHRLGDAMNGLGVMAYQDTHASYVRLGYFTPGLSCLPVP